ncbi:hypothetical protein NDU88_005927 [Pleurodeles waltl]|uniref:Uncharacterized protein n=1 Tax=Pleurodeles waltl TaxID=8319 RepID=A0AAV7NRY5_PLEWA|nr:hypothetical protein NDU88_005927 [Pleurodeles waltl]
MSGQRSQAKRWGLKQSNSGPGGGQPAHSWPESSSSGRPARCPSQPETATSICSSRGAFRSRAFTPVVTYGLDSLVASPLPHTALIAPVTAGEGRRVISPLTSSQQIDCGTARWRGAQGSLRPTSSFLVVTRSLGPREPRRAWSSSCGPFHAWVRQASQPPPIAVTGRAGSLFSSSSSAPGVTHLCPAARGQLPTPGDCHLYTPGSRLQPVLRVRGDSLWPSGLLLLSRIYCCLTGLMWILTRRAPTSVLSGLLTASPVCRTRPRNQHCGPGLDGRLWPLPPSWTPSRLGLLLACGHRRAAPHGSPRSLLARGPAGAVEDVERSRGMMASSGG